MKSLVKSVIVTSMILGGASAAYAGPMDVAFENTIVMTAETARGGGSMRFLYEPDGTVAISMEGSDSTIQGTWEIKDDEVCTTYSAPRPGANEPATQVMCTPLEHMANAKVGDTWQFSPSEKITIKGEIVAGR